MENEVKDSAFKYNYITPQAYLAGERFSEERHEYLDGQVLAMAGASLKHVRITRNITTSIDGFLKSKNCEILPTNMRVTAPRQNDYMYPDAVIVCGGTQLEDNVFDTLLNPSVIFEILSPSTRSIDKGRKLFFYQQISSVKEYIMIDTAKEFIILARKHENGGWVFEEIKDPEGSLFIRTIDFYLPLSQIYAGT